MATKEIPVEDAREWHFSKLTPTSAEICHRGDRVLVEDIIVNTNIPPLTASAMEGFYMMFTDVRYASIEVHVPLIIVDDTRAGGWIIYRLAREEAA